ncbi:hypothetical protein C8Q80DRAFT_1205474 [Daedaleopsis nitida]|nr:hypothetical protein C8Q80DRAFT_1205474 [Daedaleopsis nitida]
MHHSCATTQRVVAVIGMSQYLPWAAFSALRAYALSRSRIWTSIVLILSVAPTAVNLMVFILHNISGRIDPVSGCRESITIPLSASESATGSIISRISLIIADIILIGITLGSIQRSSRNPVLLMPIRAPRSLQDILFRDGIYYFIVMLILNTLHLICTLASILDPIIGSSGSNIVQFTEPCTGVLINRFILHLQEASSRKAQTETESSMRSESLVFTSVGISTGSFAMSTVVGSIAHRDHDSVHRDEDVGAGGSLLVRVS